MGFWCTSKGQIALTYPKTSFLGLSTFWGMSYKRYNLVLSEDTTTPYGILHFGPFEFFIRPRAVFL